MKRLVVPELLDGASGTSREVADSLADLRMINRRFGGARVMHRLLETVAAQKRLNAISLLDVAGASGDVATLLRRAMARKGVALNAVLLDRDPSHLDQNFPAVSGDALALPFPDNSFDVVACSLFLHHLEPAQVMDFVKEALRVARHAFLINDLVRHRMHLAAATAGKAIYRSRLTRHDAVASVRRAYTLHEVEAMLAQTSAASVRIKRFYLFCMGVIAWKHPHSI